MGFTCFICQCAFNEGIPAKTNVGAGDGHQQGKPVSATKCGHLFHSDCLKQHFDRFSQNAWITKPCPACNATLAAQDVLRVHACPVDIMASRQGPAMEKLLEIKKQLQIENGDLVKRLEASYKQNKSLIMEKENEQRQKEELQIRMEHVVRINSMHVSDLDRCKTETEKLKNIIITLTAKLTGNSAGEDFNNGMVSTHANHGQRLWSTEDVPPAPFAILSGSTNNDCARVPNMSHPHPPGLTLAAPAAPIQWNADTPSPSSLGLIEGNHATTNIRNSATGNSEVKMLYPFPDKPTVYDIDLIESGRNGSFGSSTNGLSSRWDALSPTLSNLPWRSNVSNEKEKSLNSRNEGASLLTARPSSSAQQIETKGAAITSREESAERGFEGDEDLDIDNSGKWHEKRRRGRPGSKGRRQSSSSASATGTNQDYSKDRQLYGWFNCTTCNAKWGSSHTFMNQPQTCRYCKTECQPFDQGPVVPRRQLDEMNKTKDDKHEPTKGGKKKDSL